MADDEGKARTRRRTARARPASDVVGQGDGCVLADPVENARLISDMLPAAIGRAEAAGLSIIAQHLARALHLAQRVASSSGPSLPRKTFPPPLDT